MAINADNVLCHLVLLCPECSMSFPGGSLARTGIDRPQQQLLLHNLGCTLRTAVQQQQDSWEAGGERQEGRTGQGWGGGRSLRTGWGEEGAGGEEGRTGLEQTFGSAEGASCVAQLHRRQQNTFHLTHRHKPAAARQAE